MPIPLPYLCVYGYHTGPTRPLYIKMQRSVFNGGAESCIVLQKEIQHLPELDTGKTASVGNVFQFELLEPSRVD